MNQTHHTTTTIPTAIAPPPLPGTELTVAADIKNKLVPYKKTSPQEQQQIESRISEINLDDRSSIIFFGSKAQEQMSSISENMLEGVKNKDLGAAGESLNNMVVAIKGFDIDELNPNKKRGFFAKLFGKAKPIVAFISKYESVKTQINRITDNLEGHKTQLLTDIISLDKLYEANLDFFHKLELYIVAGEEKLERLDQREIPALLVKSNTNKDDMLLAQQVRDLHSARDDLERRVHDLQLTRQVAMQSLPSIRLIQENDKTLINKINSTLINTVPLWKNQLAQAVTIFRMSSAADTLKGASDLTNDLLKSNAANLRSANVTVREQMERGVFDIEAVKQANQDLIATIDDSLRIADEGKKARASAVIEMKNMESKLRQTLIAAKARAG